MDKSQENLPIDLPPTNLKTKKPRISFKLILAFLLGAMVYAITAGIYNFENHQVIDDTEPVGTQQTSQQVTQTSADNDKKVSDEDLKNYVVPVDCTTLTAYSGLTNIVNLGKTVSINLYDGLTLESGLIAKWKKIPMVVDYKCNVIKITAIEENDRVNLYGTKGVVLKDSYNDVQLIQKVNL